MPFPSFYSQSDSGQYKPTAGGHNPLILNVRSVFKPSLSTALSFIMAGKVPAELGGYVVDFATASKNWALNTRQLTGTDVNVESGKVINILPPGHSQFYVSEETLPEVCRFTTTAASGSGPISLTFSTSDAKFFQVGDIITNHTTATRKVARVTAVNLSTGVVTATDWAGDTADSSWYSGATNIIENLGDSEDLANGYIRASSRTALPFRDVNAIKTYYVKRYSNVWEEMKHHDANLRYHSGNRPQAAKNRADCYNMQFQRMSADMFWGKAQGFTSTSDATTFNGIDNTISTNSTNLTTGFMSLSDIEEMLVDKLGGRHSSNMLYGFCSFGVLRVVEDLFNNLPRTSDLSIDRYESGIIGITPSVIRYRGHEVHLIPTSDFMDKGDLRFADITTKSYANKLFLVDPEALKVVVGQSDPGRPPVMFEEELNVELPDEKYYLSRNMLRSQFASVLLTEASSGKITNIKGADLNA